jgi:hypothetical protein
MTSADFSIRVRSANPHQVGSITWRAGRLVEAMQGCDVHAIVAALTALERDTTPKGISDPARWLTHFAGLESDESGKALQPWIEIYHAGQVVKTTAEFRDILRRLK